MKVASTSFVNTSSSVRVIGGSVVGIERLISHLAHPLDLVQLALIASPDSNAGDPVRESYELGEIRDFTVPSGICSTSAASTWE